MDKRKELNERFCIPDSEVEKLATFFKGFSGNEKDFNRKYTILASTVAVIDKGNGAYYNVLQFDIESKETILLKSNKN